MTNTDKTRQKLVESMRKSKTRSASESQPASRKTAPKTKKARTRRAGTKSSKATGRVATNTATGNAGSRQPAGDPYQSGRRVWPD